MARIIRSPQAQRDVVQIWAHIAADNMKAADKLIDAFDQKLNILKDFPGMGQLREELASKLRSLPVGNYLLFYRPIPDGIELVRVLHGARNLSRLFGRE
jgi:toxin ParE1/3/4